VQADFTQEKHLKILARPLVSQGIFAFQAPQSLRWEYLRPLHSILLLHEGQMRKLIEREGGFEQDNGAGIDAMRVVLQDIGSWLDGRFTDNPLFQVTRAGERTVVLIPKEQGLQAVISRIELQLGLAEGVMEQVTIFEGLESFTQLRFTNTVLNREIPAGTFTQP
jgi:outer membrane lipoprotein-sorting protein